MWGHFTQKLSKGMVEFWVRNVGVYLNLAAVQLVAAKSSEAFSGRAVQATAVQTKHHHYTDGHRGSPISAQIPEIQPRLLQTSLANQQKCGELQRPGSSLGRLKDGKGNLQMLSVSWVILSFPLPPPTPYTSNYCQVYCFWGLFLFPLFSKHIHIFTLYLSGQMEKVFDPKCGPLRPVQADLSTILACPRADLQEVNTSIVP